MTSSIRGNRKGGTGDNGREDSPSGVRRLVVWGRGGGGRDAVLVEVECREADEWELKLTLDADRWVMERDPRRKKHEQQHAQQKGVSTQMSDHATDLSHVKSNPQGLL